MLKCICGEHVSELSIHTKQYIRCMEIIERAKRDANMEGIDEIYTDLSVFLTVQILKMKYVVKLIHSILLANRLTNCLRVSLLQYWK